MKKVRPVAHEHKEQHPKKAHAKKAKADKVAVAAKLAHFEEEADMAQPTAFNKAASSKATATKGLEEDETAPAKKMVQDITIMLGACKHPDTWCTNSLSMEKQTKLNEASSGMEKSLQQILKSPTADLKRKMNAQVDAIEKVLPNDHKLK